MSRATGKKKVLNYYFFLLQNHKKDNYQNREKSQKNIVF